jgi:N-acetylmuramoyl-L-alanine amidase
MRSRTFAALGPLAAAVLLSACPPAIVPPTAPVPGAPAAALPPVPRADGPLRIDVVYPGENAQLTAADSNFVFGNVGTGEATLTINGAPVRVAPNGAWLAFVPVPADGVYNLSATARGETVTATRRVRVPAAAAARLDPGRLAIVEGSVSPSGTFTRVRGERIEVRVRGTPGAQATVILPDGRRVPLTEQELVERATGFMLDRAEVRRDLAEYVGSFALEAPIMGTDTPAVPMLVRRPGHVETRERRPAQPAVVELARGAERVTAPLTASIGMLEAAEPRVAVVASQRPDSLVIGRALPGPGQLWRWFFPNGTRLEITGESADFLRVRLARDMHVWVPAADVRLLPPGTPAPRGEAGTVNVHPAEDYARVTLSLTERLPYFLEPHERGMTVTVYGATLRTSFMGYGRTDPFVERVWWEQAADDVYRVHLELSEPLWGFAHGWDARGNLELRLRRPPSIDERNPLRGLRVAVDAGHIGSRTDVGATGPTRLTEAEAALAVTRRLVPMLQRAGAEVIEIRPDTTPVPLIQRPIIATERDAHLFVSVHFNAFPDGVNPFANHGTLQLFFWPQSLEFARHLQREILAELGLPDRGVRFQDVAIPRTTWMPSVLTESGFMMIPEFEAALRDPVVQERIARAHFRAIESAVRGR